MEWITDDSSNKNQTKWTNTPRFNLSFMRRTPKWVKFLVFAIIPLVILIVNKLKKCRKWLCSFLQKSTIWLLYQFIIKLKIIKISQTTFQTSTLIFFYPKPKLIFQIRSFKIGCMWIIWGDLTIIMIIIEKCLIFSQTTW